MKKKYFILVALFICSRIAFAQTGICPPAFVNCNYVLSAHAIPLSSTIDLDYAEAVNDSFPQYAFCLGDVIQLVANYSSSSPILGGTWQQIDANCTNVTTPSGINLVNAPVTWPLGQSVTLPNQIKTVSITQPGLYAFMFKTFIDDCGDIFDIVYVRVFPTPTANAGPDFIACNTSSLPGLGYAYMQQLNSPQTTLPSGFEGTWEWASNSPNYYISPSDIHNPNAVLHAKPLAYGSFNTSDWFRWKVENTLTGCKNYDYVNIYFPNGQHPVYAGADREICGIREAMRTNNCGYGECISNPGAGSVYWDPNAPANIGLPAPPSYFWWEFEGTYIPWPGSGYTLNTPPTIGYAGGYVTNITAGTTGLGAPNTYAAGTYTFIYHVRGYCVTGDDSINLTFKLSENITTPTNLTNVIMCSGNTTFTFTQAAPAAGEYVAWLITPNPSPGLTVTTPGLLGNVSIQPWTSGTYEIEVDFPDPNISYTVTYINTAADTTTHCSKSDAFSVLPDLEPAPIPWDNITGLPIPPTSTTPYQVIINLPCGQNEIEIPYRVINKLNFDALYPVNTNFGSIGISNSIVYTGYSGTGTLSITPTFVNNTLTNLTLPGTYHVTITSQGGCGPHVNTAYIDIVVLMPSDGASAGSPVHLDCGTNSFGMAANLPVSGNGVWSLDNSPLFPLDDISSYIIDPLDLSDNYANIVNLVTTGTYSFVWSVSNPSCGPYTYYDTIIVVVSDSTLTSTYAGEDTSYCNGNDIILYGSGTDGYWTSLDTTISFINAANPNTQIVGFPAILTSPITYSFVWNLFGGCDDISDTVNITIDPRICCLAASDSAYLHLPDGYIFNSNTILTGKYYVEGIVTVTNNAMLDITNVDMVFAKCAGIDFKTGSTIRSNNSVFRPCNIQESWRGLLFQDSTFGVIENSIFKNAIYAIDIISDTNTIRIFNNTFANNYVGINTNNSTLLEAITGNSFTIDNSFVDFYKGTCALTDTFDLNFFEEPGYIANYGISASKSTFSGLISQNNFINGSDPEQNHLFYGIFGNSISANISNNNFTNMFRSIDIGNSNGVSIFNNKIDVSLNEEPSLSGLRYNTQIRLTQSDFCKINNNKITSSLSLGKNKFTLIEFGALIYIEDNQNTEISNNQIDGGLSSIAAFDCNDSYINSNVIKRAIYVGVYLQACNTSDITCNEIFLANADEYFGEGIIVNDYDISWQNNISQIRNNCIFDAVNAITCYGPNCNYKIPNIFNNFLYNYSYTGIYVTGSGSIGNNLSPGRNTFISNNIGNGAVDIVNGDICNIDFAGNYGFNDYIGNVTILNNYAYNSTASCANQITEFHHYEFNYNLDMSDLTACTPYLFSNDSSFLDTAGSIILSHSFAQQFATWNYNEILPKSVGLMQLLSSHNMQNEISQIYNTVINANKLNPQDVKWFNYYFNFAMHDYDNAHANLLSINYRDENEGYLIKLETIRTSMLLNKIRYRQLPQSGINDLKSIVAANVPCSPMAYDLLKLAIDGYDYPFKPIVLKSNEHSKNIKSLAKNEVNVWPNPATDNVNIDFILQGDSNGQLYFYDITGNIILQNILPYQAGKISINIQNLASGMYLLMLKQDDKIVHQSKLIKK